MRTLLLLCIFLSSLNLSSQTTTFSKIFSNFPLNGENGWIVKEIPDGYFALSTSRHLSNGEEVNAMLTKLNAEGDILWVKEYPFYPGGLQCMVLDDTHVYISGFAYEVTSYQFVLYCLDMDGKMLWNTSYGEPDIRESFPNLSKTADGNLMLFGNKFRNTEPDHWVDKLVKVDLQGNKLWELEHGWQFDWNTREHILPQADGGYLISYRKCDKDTSCGLTWQGGIARLDPEGEEIWSLTLPY